MTDRSAQPRSERPRPSEDDAAPAIPIPTDTRGRIVETARRLFHEQGYHATGVATILREAGVNAGSLYHFFSGKEDLLQAVLERYVDMLAPAVMDPVEQATDDPIERVFTLLAFYRRGMEQTGCCMGCPIGNLALELSDNHPGVRPLIFRNFAGWAARVERWLEEAGDRLPEGLDRAQLARFVLTVMEGGIMQSRAAGDLSPFDDAVAQLRVHLDSLQTQARPERDAADAGARRAKG